MSEMRKRESSTARYALYRRCMTKAVTRASAAKRSQIFRGSATACNEDRELAYISEE